MAAGSGDSRCCCFAGETCCDWLTVMHFLVTWASSDVWTPMYMLHMLTLNLAVDHPFWCSQIIGS